MRKIIATLLFATLALPAIAQDRVGEVSTTFRVVGPNDKVVIDRFDDPNLPGEIQTTITLRQVFCGTELNIVQEGVPGVIPAEAFYLGWQESLRLLTQLVEAEIPDQM